MFTINPTEPRCHDKECGARETCLRWLDRDGIAARHFATLKPLWHCHNDPCPHHLPHENA